MAIFVRVLLEHERSAFAWVPERAKTCRMPPIARLRYSFPATV